MLKCIFKYTRVYFDRYKIQIHIILGKIRIDRKISITNYISIN